MLVGLIDGDGMFVIARANVDGHIKIGMQMALGVQDHALLLSLQNTLGIGTVTGPYLENGAMMVK